MQRKRSSDTSTEWTSETAQPTKSPSNDAEFLEWLYVRLVGTHGENPNTDYMQNLTSIIEKLR